MNLFGPEGAAIRAMRLVSASTAREVLDLDSDALSKRVEEGNPQWVFNISTGCGKFRALRFWAEELMDPRAVRRAELADVVDRIIGTRRPRLATREVKARLGITRNTVFHLLHKNQLAGPRDGRLQFVTRDSLAEFLKQAWIINIEKRAQMPQGVLGGVRAARGVPGAMAIAATRGSGQNFKP